MGWFDWVARRRGYVMPTEVRQQRPRIVMQRRFDAASRDRLRAELPRVPRSIDLDLRESQQLLVARARDLRQNDDYVKRFFTILKNNIVGPQGMRLQGRVMRGGELDQPANDAIEDAWTEWGIAGTCESGGKLSYREIQRMFIDTVFGDGEFLAIHNNQTDRNRFGYDITVLDPLRLDVKLNGESGGNEIKMGVERDRQTKRAIAYWIVKDDLDRFGFLETHGQGDDRHMRVPAIFVIHAFLSEFAEQTRGFTCMASAITRINMLGGYEEATLVHARVGASQMGLLEEPETGQKFEGDDEGGDEDDSGESIIEAEPGTFRNVPHGTTLHQWDPKQPTANYQEFIKSVLRGVASGLGVSYHQLANDLSDVNFSTARIGELSDRDTYKSAQEFVIAALNGPVYSNWLRNALATAAIAINGQPVGIARSARRFGKVLWQPRRWEWVDPFKMEQSNDLKVRGRRTSVSQLIRDDGRDPDDVFREIAEEREKLAELGIEIVEQPVQPGQPSEDVSNVD